MTMSDFVRPRPGPTALIVIDVQESFRERPYFRADLLPAYFAAQNRLIEGFARLDLPIVRVFHVEGEGSFSLVLDGRFATVVPVDQAVARAAVARDGGRSSDAPGT